MLLKYIYPQIVHLEKKRLIKKQSSLKHTDNLAVINSNHNFFSEMFIFFPAPAALVDENQNISAVSGELMELFGYEVNELCDQHFSILFAKEVQGRIPEILREEKSHNGISLDILCRKKNGENFPASFKSQIGFPGDSTAHWIIINKIDVEDVVFDKEILRDFDNFTDMAGVIEEPEMVVEVDAHGNILWANDVCFRKTGYSKKDLDSGLNVLKIVVPEEKEKLLRALKSLQIGKDSGINEFTIYKKNGIPMPIIISTKNIIELQTNKIHFTAFDLSEHKRVENKLLIMEKLRSLGEMTGGVAHDFNNLLSIILGYIQIIPSDCHNTYCKGIIENIKKAARDGVEVVKRLSSFPDSGEDKNFISEIDINLIVEETLEMLSNKLSLYQQEKNIYIKIKKDLGDNTKVFASESEVREVMSNLIINARDSIRTNGTITITTKRIDKNVAFIIKDTGCGMNEEIKNRIFEPFFTTKGSHGTGLGLSASFTIIQKFGGTIEVESEPAKGSTFTVIIPSSEFRNEKEFSFIDKINIVAGNPKRIDPVMIVDDEQNILEILKEFLKLEGYDVVCFGDGETAWEEYGNYRFKAVISDFNLPGMSGWQLAKKIKNVDPLMPVIILSGLGSRVEELNQIDHLADDILQKPINFSTLSSLMKRIYEDEFIS